MNDTAGMYRNRAIAGLTVALMDTRWKWAGLAIAALIQNAARRTATEGNHLPFQAALHQEYFLPATETQCKPESAQGHRRELCLLLKQSKTPGPHKAGLIRLKHA